MPQGPSTCRLVLLAAHAGLSIDEEIVSIACPQTVGSRIVRYVRAGQSSLCTQVPLLPRGVPPAPAPAVLHTKPLPRQ